MRKCCRLLVEAEVADAEHEPKIKELCSPIYMPADVTESGRAKLQGYLLNAEANGFACLFLDLESNLCKIYPTGPLCCRLFSCEGKGREQLIQSEMFQRDDGNVEP